VLSVSHELRCVQGGAACVFTTYQLPILGSEREGSGRVQFELLCERVSEDSHEERQINLSADRYSNLGPHMKQVS